MAQSISVDQLTKVYKDGKSKVVALDQVSFDLGPGEDLAIVGPSGSGKTTLLQLMAGLSRPSSGSVTIDGRDVWQGGDREVSKFRNEHIGFIFQMIHLQGYLTALENIAVPMLIKGTSHSAAMKRGRELLEVVGLAERATHYPRSMSGGEMQRVAVARALANKPQIIFADEPTGKLDKANAHKVLELMQDISQKEGVSVVTKGAQFRVKFG